MVRSMYSGVAGMRSHQVKMDVIGNNIANVNTYGFKSSRVSFKDLYYQTMSGASAGSAVSGGTNPSQVGYGSTVGSVDIMQTRSNLTMTDNGMDVAITGEGFFQVQDPDGNIFYTKAGMTRFDTAGNLVDNYGNFILGVNAANGKVIGQAPGREKIQVVVPPLSSSNATASQSINGNDFIITSSNANEFGNIAYTIISGTGMASGEKVKAEVGSNSITISINPSESFDSLENLNNEINAAIKEANGGNVHPGGTFSISVKGGTDVFQGGALTGKQILGKNFGTEYGTLNNMPAGGVYGGMPLAGVSTNFSGNGAVSFDDMRYDPATKKWNVSATIECDDGNGGTVNRPFTGSFDKNFSGSTLRLSSTDGEYVDLKYPGYTSFLKSNGLRTNQSGDILPSPDFPKLGLFGDQISLENVGAKFSGAANDEFEFQDATYDATLQQWTISCQVGANTYTGVIGNTLNSAANLELKNTTPGADGEDTITIRHKGFSSFNVANGFVPTGPTANSTVTQSYTTPITYGYKPAPSGATNVTAEASVGSKDLGLENVTFKMLGGTVGGVQTIANLTNISIGTNGVITATHAGKLMELGRIDLATFDNPTGLSEEGNTYFSATKNSGVAKLTTCGNNGSGKLAAASLEMSNVDLSKEFSEMIVTQRGFQANSRLITVSDEMLEELVNLKR